MNGVLLVIVAVVIWKLWPSPEVQVSDHDDIEDVMGFLYHD